MIHDTAMSQHIPPTLFHHVTGTWSQAAGAVASTIVTKVNDANQTSVTNVPIVIPSNSVALKGSYLKSVEIDYEVSAAAMTSVTAVINKITRGADGADASVATPAFTQTPTAGVSAEVNEHKLVLTITDPFWIDNDEYVLVELTVDQAGDTGVVEFLGAVANYTFRC